MTMEERASSVSKIGTTVELVQILFTIVMPLFHGPSGREPPRRKRRGHWRRRRRSGIVNGFWENFHRRWKINRREGFLMINGVSL